ncbi:hypothetical protein ACSF85_07210 [Moraxella bovoculi]
MPNFDVDVFVASASDWQLKNECLYIGRTAIFGRVLRMVVFIGMR